jgi:hypothetical protein
VGFSKSLGRPCRKGAMQLTMHGNAQEKLKEKLAIDDEKKSLAQLMGEGSQSLGLKGQCGDLSQ